MKILVLSHISELLGGAERSMLDVFDDWSKKYGVKPEFILRKPIKSLGTELQKRGWKFYALDYTFWSDGKPPIDAESKFAQATQNANTVLEIEKIIEKTNPDFVMTNSVVSPWAAIAAHYKKIPHVWFVREYGDLDHGRVYELGRKATLKDVGKLSTVVVTISEALAGHLAKYIDKSKIFILYNPFDIDSIIKKSLEPVSNPFKFKESLKLVIVGNLSPSKGQHEAVNAVGMLASKGRNIELCIVGDKGGSVDYFDNVESAINNFNLQKRVHMVGRQESPLPYIRHSDVGIMASRMEGFGRVTFEYLALSKPVIGSNSGATPEMVKNSVNGYLYESTDTGKLAAAIQRYLDDKNLIAKHGNQSLAQAREMMSGQYNSDELYSRIKKIHQNNLELEEPLHLSHKWLASPQLAQDYINETKTVSLKTILRQRIKRKIKWIYKNARKNKAEPADK